MIRQPPTTPQKKYSKVYVEIGNICNLQCSFCPEVIRDKKLMSIEMFRRVIREVAPLTELVALHLMGDPLVHPKLSEFVDVCNDEAVKIFLVTNGLLLRDDKSSLLLHEAFQQVNFSLHSFADNFPGKDPTHYLENIFSFTERAFERRPDLYINYRLWNLNDVHGSKTDNLDILRRICERFGVATPSVVDVRTKKNKLIKNRLFLHFDTEFQWPSLDLPILGDTGRCHGLSSHFGVLVDGTVVPCCLDKEAGIPLGNIMEQPVQEILNQPRAKNLLEGFKQKRLVEDLCKRCQYIERFR